MTLLTVFPSNSSLHVIAEPVMFVGSVCEVLCAFWIATVVRFYAKGEVHSEIDLWCIET